MSFLLQMHCPAASQPLHSPLQVKEWIAKGVMPQVLRYHMVGCANLLYNDLTAITNITSLHGDLIHISYSQVTKHGETGAEQYNSLLPFTFLKTSMVPSPLMHKNKSITLK